ncbi:MAG: hypothetical protein QNJ75_01640 [Acidimicrobiia bacterium]|nr:hypothetical protein [Acidimicrobiia bacterium]
MRDSNAAGDVSLWRRRFFRSNPVVRFTIQASVALSVIVAAPALVARQWADERFVMYMPEHLVGSRPWELFKIVVDEIPGYLDTGVFRPFSRLVFYLEHWAVLRFSTTTGIHPNVTMAAVKILMVFLLVTMAMLTIDQYRQATGGKPGAVHWRRLYGLTAVLIAISLVLFNPATHPLTLFPTLYLGTAAVALAIPLWFGRTWLRYRAGEPLPRMWMRVGSAVIIGALVASSIEIAALALPLGFIHLLLLSFAAGDSWVTTWKDMFHSEAFLLWALVVTGYLVVFIPTRVAIADYCAQLSCYRAAEVSIGADAVAAFPYRVGSSFFPLTQLSQIHLLSRLRGIPELVLLAAAAAGLGYVVLGRTAIEYEDDERGRRPRLPMALIATYFGAVLLLASALASVSAGVQDKGADFSPWRETGFTWIAWAVIIAVLLTAAYDLLTDRWAIVVSVGLAALLALSSIVNQVDMTNINAREDTRLYNQAGLMLVNFDRTESGNTTRCAVMDDLRAFAPRESEVRKMDLIETYLNSAASNIYGDVFCDPSS